MLTQEQANDLNIQLHAKEAAEIWLNNIQEEINKYVETINQISEAMKTADPEKKERIRALMPQILEWYNSAKLKKGVYEEEYWNAQSKINDYRTLEQQQQAPVAQTRRRTVNNNNIDWNERWNNEYKNNPNVVVDTPTNVPTSYKDDPLYPEFQEFLNWKDNIRWTENYVVQNDWTKTSPDMTYIVADWIKHPLKLDESWRYYYNQTWNAYTYPNGQTFNPSNVKIYPSFGWAWQYKTSNWATIWPSSTHETTVSNVTPTTTRRTVDIRKPRKNKFIYNNVTNGS